MNPLKHTLHDSIALRSKRMSVTYKVTDQVAVNDVLASSCSLLQSVRELATMHRRRRLFLHVEASWHIQVAAATEKLHEIAGYKS